MRNHDFNEWYQGFYFAPDKNEKNFRLKDFRWVRVDWPRMQDIIRIELKDEPESICSICSWRKDHPLHEN